MADAPKEPPKHDVYADESSQTGHRFIVIGGVIAETADVPEIVGALMTARKTKLPFGEMKWGKVSASKYIAYRAFVDTFFSLSRRDKIHFHCLVADSSKHDHVRYNSGSKEVGFSKEVYQILMKFGRRYDALLYVYLDQRTTSQTTQELRLILNRGIAKHHKKTNWPYRRVVFRDSKQTQVLQLVDILLGAIAYRRNGHHLKPDASPAKSQLSAHVLAKAGISDISRDCYGRCFSVWNRKYGVPRL